MSSQFYKINIQTQYKKNESNFDKSKFNKNFQDLKILSEIDGGISDTITYEGAEKKQNDVNETIIDYKLAKGKNYYNPYLDNYINPKTLSNDRLVLIALIDKFSKKVFILPTYSYNRYTIPGGRPYIFENSENAAVRKFKEVTGILIEKKKIFKLCNKDIFITKSVLMQTPETHETPETQQITHTVKVCTYIVFVFDQMSYIQTPQYNDHWLPIKELTSYNSKNFNRYYSHVYTCILQHLY